MPGSIPRLLRPAALLAALTGATLVAAPLAAASPGQPTAVVTGIVRAVDGAPLRSVTAQVLVDGIDAYHSAQTGADGRYRVKAPRTSGVQIQFYAGQATGGTSATGYADACAEGPALCQTDGQKFDLTGSGSRRVDATLGRAGVLRGRVVDTLGRGVGGLSVSANITSIQSPARASRPDASAVTDVNGNWSFGRVNPLGWAVLYEADDSPSPLTPGPYGYVTASAAATVAGGKTVTLAQKLAGFGAIVGTVVDESGAPIAGAEVRTVVSLPRITLFPSVTTDAQGRFELDDLPPGRRPVCVDAANYDDPCWNSGTGNVVKVAQIVPTSVTFVLHRTS